MENRKSPAHVGLFLIVSLSLITQLICWLTINPGPEAEPEPESAVAAAVAANPAAWVAVAAATSDTHPPSCFPMQS